MKITLLRLICCCATLFFAKQIQAQDKYTISGYIEDLESGEKLIGANVFDVETKSGTVSNTYGFFSMTLPKADSVYLTVSYIGYQPKAYGLVLNKDIAINFALSSSLELDVVEVTAEKVGEEIQERTQMSVAEIPIKQIKNIPMLFGETDVLKALQLLPGVQSGGEGQSGLYVRGGSPDQNLILLDGTPVYNASHLFGFFSVFNADAIKDVTLTKGGFPARYGGRLSSVLEINMKEGNMKEFKGSGSIGLISSKLTYEGPIKKDKTSFIVSGRRTYIDILAQPIIRNAFSQDGGSGTAGYYFYDFNAKVNHKFSEKDRLYLSFYSGDDNFYLRQTEKEDNGDKYETDIGLGWGNLTSAARWNHLWTNRLFSNVTLTYTQYNFDTGFGEKDEYSGGGETERYETNFGYNSGINDVAGRIDFDFVPNPNHFIRFGVSDIYHTFKPGAVNVNFIDTEANIDIDTTFGQRDVYAHEFSAYVEDDMKVGDKLKMNVGLHFSGFHTKDKTYTSFQPRFGARYLLPKDVALKASFATMRQYVQFLTNDNLGLPTDLWLPTTDRVLPQDSWQVALGLAKTINKQYEVSIEAYYKEMKNVISYKEGASFLSFEDWQDNVTQGEGLSYGGELFIQKKYGQFTGWIGYTLSWTFRQFDDVNFGERYPYKFDRRHDLSLVGTYEFNDRVSLSATWVYGTGNAFTLAEATYDVRLPTVNGGSTGFLAEYYTGRNNERMRDYHRFDFGINFSKQKKRYKRTWSFGAYNAYNRNNPFFLYLDQKYTYNDATGESTRQTELKQASLFPIIPYATWSFEF